MSKRVQTAKLLPVWVAISAVVILAGAILLGLLGFNYGADVPSSKRFEVIYDTVVTIGEDTEEQLQKLCEDTFAENGLTVVEKHVYTMTGGGSVEYVFAGDADTDALKAAKTAVETALTDENGIYADADTSVSFHEVERQYFTEATWRGAVAIAVGAVVALVYVGVRFGVGKALAGLIGAAHDALFTLAVIVICRIPVFGYAPVLFAAFAVFVSLMLWGFVCAKMRANFKDPAYVGLSAAEAVEESRVSALRPVLGVVVVTALAFALLGGLATAGMRYFFLPALIPVAVGTYSSLVLVPAIYAQFKKISDRMAAKRKRYDYGKGKKSDKTETA